MEKYVYYSIAVFSGFIVLLYIYLLYEKVINIFSLKKIKRFENELIPYIDKLCIKFEEDETLSDDDMKNLKLKVKDRVKRGVIRDRIIYYIENYIGDIRSKLIYVCEEIGLLDYEIKRIDSKDPFRVALSCRKLGEMRSPKAAEALLNALYKNQIDIKYQSLMALAKIGEIDYFAEAFEVLDATVILSERSLVEIVDSFEGNKLALYGKMINHKNPIISSVFIKSAGKLVDSKISEEIARFIEDEDKNRKIAAIKSIGQIGDIRFIEEIISALQDDSWEVRAIAAKSLGNLQDSRCLPYLKESLKDREWWVRYNSAWSIIRIPRGVEVIEEVLRGEDKFAKDILISAIENSGIINEIYTYESSIDLEKRKIYKLVSEYIGTREL